MSWIKGFDALLPGLGSAIDSATGNDKPQTTSSNPNYTDTTADVAANRLREGALMEEALAFQKEQGEKQQAIVKGGNMTQLAYAESADKAETCMSFFVQQFDTRNKLDENTYSTDRGLPPPNVAVNSQWENFAHDLKDGEDYNNQSYQMANDYQNIDWSKETDSAEASLRTASLDFDSRDWDELTGLAAKAKGTEGRGA